MNSFSFNRFGQTLRWVLANNFRNLLFFSAGIAFAIFFGELFIYGLNGMDSTHSPVRMLWDFADIGSAMMTVTTVIMVSSVVSSINDKRKRATFLMLPSSNLEKFLALVFYTTVICVLGMLLAYIVGDTLRMAAIWGNHLLTGEDAVGEVAYCNGVDETFYYWSSSVPWMLSKLIPRLLTVWTSGIYWTWQNEWSTLIYHVVLAVWVHSVYTLGGMLLRKYAFVVTSVVLLSAVYLFNFSGLTVYNWVDHVLHGITTIGVMLCFVLPIFAAYNYWASFRIFKGFQLITNKWFNYDILKR